MGRLLIVSNRLPISVEKRREKLSFHPSMGGVATGLGAFHRAHDSLWIGWPGVALDELSEHERCELERRLEDERCRPVFLSASDVEGYYHGFCNRTIWPLFHCFTQYPVYEKELWERYRRVNEAFCDAVLRVAGEDDVVWVHDYQLMLLPKLIREQRPDATIGFFLHIPFPSFEVFRLLPWRRELLDGMLGADLVGLHTYHYAQNFIESVRQLFGYEDSFGQITAGERVVKVDVFPMGIPYERFASAVHDPAVQREAKKMLRQTVGRKVILSIDRMDYTKGILQRLKAFDAFLERYPEYRERVTLILVAVPSRTGVEHYAQLKRKVNELVGNINGKHATMGWIPIWYMSRGLPFKRLVALYSIADVALITPLRDGMNLMAKEFIASKTDGRGVLILSEMAGAAEELGEAIIVNPNSEEEVVHAMRRALEMPQQEQVERNRIMQARLRRYDVGRWAGEFLEGLKAIRATQMELKARRLTPEVREGLLRDYASAERRLILLDYDGTLVPFERRPERAVPDEELLGLLDALSREPKNRVVVISGRSRATLDAWFGSLDVVLIAEHGVWVRQGEEWERTESIGSEWKEEIRPLLELYVDRTPGSFIEEKDFSLVWHYRNADPRLASIRARELKDALLSMTANLNLGVMEGSKVLEIKDAVINKGRSALRCMSWEDWDFILAVGDDRTDEDMFAVLPAWAYSIKVGLGLSRARFSMGSHHEVRGLLGELVAIEDEG
ncbi:bifunctional alpha,alpha-trehalose-phosphate synthase (UDP-forming)/trehalose-phosphatase [Methermicoccus shengliensis]|uniref:Alpha,alpha-trehalose-phosphate synthase n=1 Tax=Methermicoccus shengliensis TaxID=660064 RepID=A0A832W0G0_9EURY|nr:bifunctional alpha,alpha-trehalose-phosphate synthase (UDP-forming)/trehalose-phosphatase [Methermicoccus shengliensis]KUK29698.1 MAG: Alpha,alpha-trehalose-phosphate synthase (UDP-forming) [Methanosarcinales archeaon 56_1174]MDI3488037.1 trehalose 6-phosphate synthase/phosphatase [Methanosarcinales archaeon]MDN5295658.1 trehalose 6-phosphate synthase/phosphatase [Methanosarcinales archaeon]HIH70354.1 bifunctional alpha,alpha-trehalose-phosphate synthase (UDP-forming)/trehalose-phosphatase [